MTIFDPIRITFVIQNDDQYNTLIQEVEKIDAKIKASRVVEFNKSQSPEEQGILTPDIIIMDYNPESGLGMDCLEYFRKHKDHVSIILYVARDHAPQAIDELKNGVEDYVTHLVPSKLFAATRKCVQKIEGERNLLDQKKILKRIEKKNIALLNAQPDFMLQVSKDGLILDYKPSKESKALLDLFQDQELQGRELQDFFPKDVSDSLLEIIDRVMETAQPEDFEFKLMTLGVIHRMEARLVKLTYIEVLIIIREFKVDHEREEEYYRAISRISRYRHKEDLVKELLNHMVDSDKNLLSEEKKKADMLLANILPSYMIDDLKKSGKVQPVQYDQASVMFTDFVGFSNISKYMSPTQLLKELTIYFDEFERICETYGIEKVKTIGDSFLCVSGLGKNQRTSTIDILLAAIEMARFTQQRKDEIAKNGESAWGIRIAIHSGALIAGVVGHKKIAFDIWGHTVNTAARIESVSKGGKITVSRAVYDGARDYFDFDFAGEQELKGVGAFDLYTLYGLKQGLYAKNSDAMVPNRNFYRLYEALRDGKHVLRRDGKYFVSSPKFRIEPSTSKEMVIQ